MRSDRIDSALKRIYVCGNCQSINKFDSGNIIAGDKLISISECNKFLGIPRRLIEDARNNEEIDFIDISNTGRPRTLFRLSDVIDWMRLLLRSRYRKTQDLIDRLDANEKK